ncbi:paired amphipathic helix protein Sin3a [Marchantia polymorpha subsp. ruderalis]
MKRKRVEEAPMTLVKRNFSDHEQGMMAEPQLSRPETDGPKTHKQNGVAFLKMVKETLKDEVERYDAFVKSMQSFKRGLISTREVIKRVKGLFKNHPSLILGFNIFLRPSDRIEVPAEDEVDVEKLKVALRFVNKVKVRFTNEGGHVYRSFLGILRAFKFGMSVKEVHENVISLFRGHEDLLVEFRDFLPTRSLRNWVSLVASVVQRSKVAPLPSCFHEGPESSHREPEHAQEEAPVHPPPRENSKWKAGAQEQGTESAADRRVSDKEAVDAVKDSTRAAAEVVKDVKKRRCDTSISCESNGLNVGGQGQVRRLRRRKGPILAVPETAVPHAQKRRRQCKESGTSEAAQLAFFETVSKELEGSSVYKEFMQCMNLCRLQIITTSQLQVLVNNVLDEHPHLQKAFHSSFPSHRRDPFSILNQWQTCTPSYRLHDNTLSEKASTSSESTSQADDDSLGPYSTRGVLNDTWITLTTGGNAFTSQESNRYEEILFRCEDDQYELDMLIETTISTAGKLSECIEILKDPSHPTFDLEEHLSPLHLRCIERIYCPVFASLLSHARANPATTLPVILGRLEQRLEDWKSARPKLNKVWAQVRAANHSKSLVYESEIEYPEKDEGESITDGE